MNNNFYVSDWHFDDEDIMNYRNDSLNKKQFKDVEHMNSLIIDNHNKVVAPTDNVYVAGDVSILWDMFPDKYKERFSEIIHSMNGVKHLILGNHEHQRPDYYQEVGFTSVHSPFMEVIKDEVYIVHDPALSFVNRDMAFIVGHIHDLFVDIHNCFNVCVDVRDYYPSKIKKVPNNRKALVVFWGE